MSFHRLFGPSLLALVLCSTPAFGQLRALKTDSLRLVYTSSIQSYLVPQVFRTYANARDFHAEMFDYELPGRMSMLMHDLWHYGNAGARALPNNHISFAMSPPPNLFETNPSNERLNSWMNHEMVHIVTTDKAAGVDRTFRQLFFGKVNPDAEDPLSMGYSFLTNPRWYSPRWFLEGIAVYLQTWMAGGLGRALGAYDEMVFRTLVRDDARIYDFVGLESEGTTIDFRVGANSYLYGTRFLSYVALTYGNDVLIKWVARYEGGKRYFSHEFEALTGVPLEQAWEEWIAWERDWQQENLEAIRRNPVTQGRPLSGYALGSVSRSFFDQEAGKVYVAMSYPGQVAQIAAIDVETGAIDPVTDIIGAGGMYVTALAFDPDLHKIFYTTNNGNWRNLVSIDLRTGKKTRHMKNARIGDLVIHPVDKAVWAVRHFNGIATVVRIEAPYDDWDQVYSLPYGRVAFDLEISPDGRTLVASLLEADGNQKLVAWDVDRLTKGQRDPEILFDFGLSPPQNFVYSPDGRFLYGSSYYSGASNIFRYNVEEKTMQPLSNAETGYFRPLPVTGDSLVVFEYTARGFVPTMIPNEVPERVSAIRFLGNEIAENRPEVQSWLLQPSRLARRDSIPEADAAFSTLRNMTLESVYPIVQGYRGLSTTNVGSEFRDAAAVGLRVNFSDGLGFSSLTIRASVSPWAGIDDDETIHLGLRLKHWNWEATATLNEADFYDLFGPTKVSRKGYSASLQYEDTILYDDPKRLSYSARLGGYGGLETLPDYQNVAATFDKLLTLRASLDYEFLQKSLGAVEDELGFTWSLHARGNYVNGNVFPRAHAETSVGRLLPINHSSVWLRGAAGWSFASDRDDPFARFYFGDFGNNWVDHGSIKRFRDYDSFPGIRINEVGGASFARIQGEWVLPPIRFRRAGWAIAYLRWASVSLFAGALTTDFDRSAQQRTLANVGGQLDVRLVTFSHLDSTLSFGYGLAFERDADESGRFMVSFKIL